MIVNCARMVKHDSLSIINRIIDIQHQPLDSRLDYQPLFGKMSPHSSIKDRTRETAEMEFNYNSVRYFNTRQWTPANSPGRLCGSVRTVSLEKELLGTSVLARVLGLPKGLRERSPLFPRNA